MADPDRRSRRDDSHSRSNGDDDLATKNPFVAFRRFADEQMATAVSTVYSIFQQSPTRRQQMIDEYDAWLKEGRQEQSEAQHTADMYRQAYKEQVTGALEEGERASCGKTSEQQKAATICPFRKARIDATLEDPAGVWESCLSTLYDDTGDSIFSDRWLRSNLYSPVVLGYETAELDQSRKWRAAFEDLLYAHTGLNLPAHRRPVLDESEDDKWWMNGLHVDFAEAAAKTLLHDLQLAGNAVLEICESSKGTDLGPGFDHDQNQGKPPSLWNNDLLRICAKLPPGEARGKCLKSWASAAVSGSLGLERGKVSQCPAGGIAALIAAQDDDEEACHMAVTKDSDAYQAAMARKVQDPDTEPTSCPFLAARETSVPEQESQPSNPAQSKAPWILDIFNIGGPTTAPQISQADSPTVVSELTTTVSRTLPDGTKSTTVVLKKRFSDGVEESTERNFVESVGGWPKPASVAAGAKGKWVSAGTKPSNESEKAEEKKEAATRSKGWFWS